MEKHLHIITHEIPWPPEHGGLMDIFHKIKSLHAEGIIIHLHCFSETEKDTGPLRDYCRDIFIYDRKSLPAIWHWHLPYIVSSRVSYKLIGNLLADNHPVLIDGIHCAYPLLWNKLKGRKVFLRVHNAEFIYYRNLMKLESNPFRKIYFKMESFQLKRFERKIAQRATLLFVSTADQELYRKMFGARQGFFLPVFTGFSFNPPVGRGKYCLYHGNLSVNENHKAANWLFYKVFKKLSISFVIAGKNPAESLRDNVNKHTYGSIVADPNNEILEEIIHDAHIHLVPSFNNTGVKLKLLHALFRGRFCVVNDEAVKGSGLESLCIIASDDKSFRDRIRRLIDTEFTEEMIRERKTVLEKLYDNRKNASDLIQWIYSPGPTPSRLQS